MAPCPEVYGLHKLESMGYSILKGRHEVGEGREMGRGVELGGAKEKSWW